MKCLCIDDVGLHLCKSTVSPSVVHSLAITLQFKIDTLKKNTHAKTRKAINTDTVKEAVDRENNLTREILMT